MNFFRWSCVWPNLEKKRAGLSGIFVSTALTCEERNLDLSAAVSTLATGKSRKGWGTELLPVDAVTWGTAGGASGCDKECWCLLARNISAAALTAQAAKKAAVPVRMTAHSVPRKERKHGHRSSK
jgi:hypothetical protein